MKIVILEAKSLGDDISFTAFEQFGEVKVYLQTTREQMAERIRDAQVVIVNKLPVCEDTLKDAPLVELVCVTATGTNNLDWDYLEKRGITAYNVAGYSTDAVAQHTFALLFYVLEKLRFYDEFVKSGEYAKCGMFSYYEEKFTVLSGKTWGILGMGAIGRKVAQIADAFGCRVICCSASGNRYDTEYEQVDLPTLFECSDILSIHAPLNKYTENLINQKAFEKMKRTAILLNLARGPIVNEADLAEALETGMIAGAGLDVLSAEPIRPDNPLQKIQDSKKLLITPHIAWAATESRRKCVEGTIENIRRYLQK